MLNEFNQDKIIKLVLYKPNMDNYLAMSIDEFEEYLRYMYEQYAAPYEHISMEKGTKTPKDTVGTRSVTENITQSYQVGNGKFYMSSKVFSPSGSPGTYKYTAITGFSHDILDIPHYRFGAVAYSLGNNDTACSVQFKNVTYWANRTMMYTVIVSDEYHTFFAS